MLVFRVLLLTCFFVVASSLFSGGLGLKGKTTGLGGNKGNRLARIRNLKEAIFEEAKGTANGVKASPEKRARIQSLVNDLERLNGEKRSVER